MRNKIPMSVFILLATLSCIDRPYPLLRNNLSQNGSFKFYKDLDIFSRQGINEITADTLTLPFFRVQMNADSSITLGIFKHDFEREIVIPKNDTLLYDFDDIHDGPRHNYYKILRDSIVVFGYENKIDEVDTWPGDSVFLFGLLPTTIEIMTSDTLYTFFQDCLNIEIMDKGDTEIEIAKKDLVKYSVQPFSLSIDIKCEHCIVHYFDTTNHIRHYFRGEREPGAYLSKTNPGDGQYLYKREFKYWRDYYIID